MILPTLLLGAIAAAHPSGFLSGSCRKQPDLATPVLRSRPGFRVRLTLHTDGDHGKETHFCQSDYTLRITHPDGTVTDARGFFGNDDAWDRPITIRLAGFTYTGSSAIILLSEGGPNPLHEIILYDLEANTWEIADAAGALAHQLPPACLDDLRVLGTTSGGDVVITPPARPGCDGASRWILTLAGSDTGAPLAQPAAPVPASAPLLPIDHGQ